MSLNCLKASSWYRRAVANDKATEAKRFQRAPKARSPEADAQAVTYAQWLMQRDGVCLDTMRAKAVEAIPVVVRKQRGREWDENATLRDTIANARTNFKVRWEPTEHGYRPRCVEMFEFRGSYPDNLIHTVELPNWAAAWEVVDDFSEPLYQAA